jgi:hypothetical protein
MIGFISKHHVSHAPLQKPSPAFTEPPAWQGYPHCCSCVHTDTNTSHRYHWMLQPSQQMAGKGATAIVPIPTRSCCHGQLNHNCGSIMPTCQLNVCQHADSQGQAAPQHSRPPRLLRSEPGAAHAATQHETHTAPRVSQHIGSYMTPCCCAA